MIHTNAIAYGFLANAFLGVLHWAVPRLTLKPVLSSRCRGSSSRPGRSSCCRTAVGIVFGPTLQANSRAGRAALLAGRPGRGMGRDAGLDRPAGPGRAAAGGDQLHGARSSAPTGPLYVTLWYFMAAFVWTFLTYAMGNFIPQYFVAGTSAGAVGGLFIHDLVGLFVTPLGWGLMYYFVPILLQQADLEPRAVAGRLLGTGVLLSADRHPPLPLHADSDVPAVRGGHLDDRRRDGGHDRDHQLLRHDLGLGPGDRHQPADPLVLHRHGLLRS